MDQPLTTIISRRIRARLSRWVNRIRGLKFRQWMGLVLIVRTFNPIIIPLGLVLIFYFFVVDLSQNQVIVESRATIEAGIQNVERDVQELDDAIDGIVDDFQVLRDILQPVVDLLQTIVGVINDIVEFLGFPSIDLPELPGIPDFSLTFGIFSSIRDAAVDSLQAFGKAYAEILDTFGKWWRILQYFVVISVIWLALSFFSGLYSNFSRGLEMLRGAPALSAIADPTPRTWDGRPVFETPPILVLDRAQITVPTVQSDRDPGGKRRTGQHILRQQRVLLSAQAVWPDRHLDLYHYELADRADEGAWGYFMDRLIARGLDPAAVQLVLSPDVRAISPMTERYLPSATVQRAVQTRVVPG